MEVLKQRILNEGKATGSSILKVDSFLNHQVDVSLLNEIGKEFKKRFSNEKITKILTVEASGIAIACLTVLHFDTPVIFAKKTETSNIWIDVAKEKEAAVAVLDEGCDVLTLHNDSTAVHIEAQDRGASVIGYNLDIPDAAPKAYMTAPVWNWGPYYVDQVKKAMDGSWKSEAYAGGLADGLVELAPLTGNAPEGTQAKIDEVKKKILDGSFKVFTGPLKDQSGNIKVPAGEVVSEGDIAGSMDWFVQGVEGKTNAE